MRILMAYDGSDNAKRALSRAIELSKGANAELTIIHYVDLEAFETFAAKHLFADLRDKTVEHAESLVADASHVAERSGVTSVRTLLLQDGDPADAILAAAVSEKADLIVVGRRGVRGIQRFLLGSVSSRVVDHARCDVLVVR